MMFAFVILNYNSIDETILCIRSINGIDFEDKVIIVIDNASDDENALDIIRDKTNDIDTKIVFIKSKKNIGYAKGNNIGIHHAKHDLHADYICVINPDSVICNQDFIDKCLKDYQKYRFAVAGPKIIHGSDEKNINPLGGYKTHISEIIRSILMSIKIIVVKKIGISVRRIMNRQWDVENQRMESSSSTASRFIQPDGSVQLSGACLIFSPDFLYEYEGFCKHTFLYGEENILFFCCHKLGLKVFYDDELLVRHLGGQSVGTKVSDDRNKMIFFQKHVLWSSLCLLHVVVHKYNKSKIKEFLCPDICYEYEIMNQE